MSCVKTIGNSAKWDIDLSEWGNMEEPTEEISSAIGEMEITLAQVAMHRVSELIAESVRKKTQECIAAAFREDSEFNVAMIPMLEHKTTARRMLNATRKELDGRPPLMLCVNIGEFGDHAPTLAVDISSVIRWSIDNAMSIAEPAVRQKQRTNWAVVRDALRAEADYIDAQIIASKSGKRNMGNVKTKA